MVNGFPQDSIDGVSMVYTFADAKAQGTRKTQFFDIMASRGIYHDGWFASAMGPREPWVAASRRAPRMVVRRRTLGTLQPGRRLESSQRSRCDRCRKSFAMKDLFLIESTRNKNLPIGGGCGPR